LTLPRESSFTEQVGSTFEVMDVPPSTFELKMTRVVEHAKSDRQEAFSVFFVGPAERFMQQGIRKIRHAQLGEMEVFLVPVAKTGEGFEYEAAFNYILNP
jgi:hypothetical protein